MSTNQLGLGAPASGRILLLRWLIAAVAYPIGGTAGHLVAGPAAAVPAALISGLIAGGVIGAGQALALGLRLRAMALWAAATAVGLGLALSVVTGAIGQIDTMLDAMLLGVVSGAAIGAGQAAVLVRERGAGLRWIWVPASAIAWAVGWSVTAAVGVALAPGWAVFGLSGAIVCQLIIGVVLSVADAPAAVDA